MLTRVCLSCCHQMPFLSGFKNGFLSHWERGFSSKNPLLIWVEYGSTQFKGLLIHWFARNIMYALWRVGALWSAPNEVRWIFRQATKVIRSKTRSSQADYSGPQSSAPQLARTLVCHLRNIKCASAARSREMKENRLTVEEFEVPARGNKFRPTLTTKTCLWVPRKSCL